MPLIRYNGEYCHFLSTISDTHNFAIAVRIMQKGPMTHAILKEEIGLSDAKLKKHLNQLLFCSYLFSKKKGKEITYYLNHTTVRPLIKIMNRHIGKYQVK